MRINNVVTKISRIYYTDQGVYYMIRTLSGTKWYIRQNDGSLLPVKDKKLIEEILIADKISLTKRNYGQKA